MICEVSLKIDDALRDVARENIPKSQPPRLAVKLVQAGSRHIWNGAIEEIAPLGHIVESSRLRNERMELNTETLADQFDVRTLVYVGMMGED